jgi:hypothetical protein
LKWTEIIPTYNDFVYISVLGKYYNGSVFDLTDSADAVLYNLDAIVMVYGPAKVQLNRTFAGFQRALTQMHERSEAIILIPHNLAFQNYEPIVYTVNLHRVIRGNSIAIAAYEKQQMDSVRLLLGITDSDTIPNMANAYSIISQAGDTLPDIVPGNSVTIEIYGYYAEADPYYMDTTKSFLPGRQFYRFGTDKDIVTYLFGEAGFPVSPVVDSVVYQVPSTDLEQKVSRIPMQTYT